MEHSIFACFDPPMIAVHGFVAADRRILKAVSFLFCRKQLDILAQSALIAFPKART